MLSFIFYINIFFYKLVFLIPLLILIYFWKNVIIINQNYLIIPLKENRPGGLAGPALLRFIRIVDETRYSFLYVIIIMHP
jgi:hypothetical protein